VIEKKDKCLLKKAYEILSADETLRSVGEEEEEKHFLMFTFEFGPAPAARFKKVRERAFQHSPPPPLPASSHADQMSEFRPFSFLFILGRCCFAFSASVSCARGNTLANEKSKKQTRICDFYFRF
jgi:hypothetical protein